MSNWLMFFFLGLNTLTCGFFVVKSSEARNHMAVCGWMAALIMSLADVVKAIAK